MNLRFKPLKIAAVWRRNKFTTSIIEIVITQLFFFFIFRFMSIWGRNYVHCTKMIVFLTSLSVVGMAMILPLWQAPTTISSECSTGSPDRKSLMKLPKKLPNLRLSLNLEKWVLIFKEKKCWINSNILRSLEVRGLCLMKWPSKMLQKLPYF